MLSYSFSTECPVAQRRSFLLQAQEAFTIGLLTKSEGELVSSKQELHTFLKAAYSLAVTHKWLGASPETVTEAVEACLKALEKFYDYDSDAPNKDSLCTEIMRLVVRVKGLLGVEPFENSEPGSFIPVGYRNTNDASVNFTPEGFARALQRFQRYHASLCEATNKCKGSADEMDGARVCITALGTTVDGLNTACKTEACGAVEAKRRGPSTSMAHSHHNSELGTTVESTDELGSSWQNFSSILGSPANSTTGRLQSVHAVASSTSNGSGEMFEVIQAGIETLDTGEDGKPTAAGETLESLSQLVLRTSSNSLSSSFGSRSSWEKADMNPTPATKPAGFSNAGMGQRNTSAGSDGSFQFLETLDFESADSAGDHVSQGDFKELSQPQPLESHHAISVDSAFPKQAAMGAPHPNIQLASTEISPESSFEMPQEGPMKLQSSDGASASEESAPERRNQLCYRCINGGAAVDVVPERQYSLSQQDYRALLAGVCHHCMLKRFYSEKTKFKLKQHRTAHSKCELACLFIVHAILENKVQSGQ